MGLQVRDRTGKIRSVKNRGFELKTGKKHYREFGSIKKITDTEKFVTGNYLEVGKGLPYRKICFQNDIGNNFGQDGNLGLS